MCFKIKESEQDYSMFMFIYNADIHLWLFDCVEINVCFGQLGNCIK